VGVHRLPAFPRDAARVRGVAVRARCCRFRGRTASARILGLRKRRDGRLGWKAAVVAGRMRSAIATQSGAALCNGGLHPPHACCASRRRPDAAPSRHWRRRGKSGGPSAPQGSRHAPQVLPRRPSTTVNRRPLRPPACTSSAWLCPSVISSTSRVAAPARAAAIAIPVSVPPLGGPSWASALPNRLPDQEETCVPMPVYGSRFSNKRRLATSRRGCWRRFGESMFAERLGGDYRVR
jgi:hypothetical protein